MFDSKQEERHSFASASEDASRVEPDKHPTAGEIAVRLKTVVEDFSGADEVYRLAQDLERIWPKLSDLFARRSTSYGHHALGKAVHYMVEKFDRPEITGKTIRLRNEFAVYAPSNFDIYVGSLIAYCILDLLCERKGGDPLDTATDVVNSKGNRSAFDFAFLFNLVAAFIAFRDGNYEKVVEIAKDNLTYCNCPASQRYLFDATEILQRNGQSTFGIVARKDQLKEKFCPNPFTTLATGTDGRKFNAEPTLHACNCPSALPFRIKGNTIAEAWNGREAQEIRRSILEGDFSYCRQSCHLITQNKLPNRKDINDPWLKQVIHQKKTVIDRKPTRISLGHDSSCNIACPSCRSEIIPNKASNRERFAQFNKTQMLPFLAEHHCTVYLSNDGDPFYGKSYRHFLENIDPKTHARLTFGFLTNGLLLTPDTWSRLKQIHGRVHHIGVSIDGADQEVYEDLRRPGKWETIVRNMEFVSQMRRDGHLRVLSVQFVVQERNFHQMPRMVELCRSWSVDALLFIKIFNGGHSTAEKFLEKDVADERHPRHPELLGVLQDEALKDPICNLWTLTPIAKKLEKNLEILEHV